MRATSSERLTTHSVATRSGDVHASRLVAEPERPDQARRIDVVGARAERRLERGDAVPGPRVAAVVHDVDLGRGAAVLPHALTNLGRDAGLDVVRVAAVV